MKSFDKLRNALDKASTALDELEDNTPEKLLVETYKYSRDFSEEENMGLPLPRLEIRTVDGDHELICISCLVTRHYAGNIHAVCTGWSVISGYMGNPNVPYEPNRACIDIRFDMHTLNLPGYLTRPSTGAVIQLNSFREHMGYDPKPISYG